MSYFTSRHSERISKITSKLSGMNVSNNFPNPILNSLELKMREAKDLNKLNTD